ncbi:uncharacterized UDP-glucosyltransferase YojK [Hydra vulgaris]|uniref:uncharacterized UDP-glucosyltransferase YojK n=1 Tax=Hydra vulgaris TaxID=6087 RepID=UPI001F5FBE21|nr:uncharacterized UDP-glucosyltransferase YojK-like [Hydra vulgaris]XP_047144056.1 uncharacterized UDP-glucosyltransferase YojK-like [Hydra vulgaris]
MQQKKILILIPPFWGHINPLIGITKRLVEESYIIVFYSLSEFKDIIVKTGAEYREYPYFPIVKANEKSHVPTVITLFTSFLDIADQTIPYFVDIFEKEKPDLIIYDFISFYSKCLLIHLQHRYLIGVSNIPPPKALLFFPSFCLNIEIFPEENFLKTMIEPVPNEEVIKSFEAHVKKVSDKYSLNLSTMSPIEYMTSLKEKLVIVSTFRELQPKGEEFKEPYKFVGSCSVTENREFYITDPKVKQLLGSFDPINPIKSLTVNKTCKILIYASLGTVFNENVNVFECIINAIRTFDQEKESTKSAIKLN